jgi:hypothetical protein
MERDASAPRGALSGDIGTRLEFSGWAELAAAIEEWRARIRRDEDGEEHVG